jgi:hypothetical protein
MKSRLAWLSVAALTCIFLGVAVNGCTSVPNGSGGTTLEPTAATTQAVVNVESGAAVAQQFIAAVAPYLPTPTNTLAGAISAAIGGISVISAAVLAYFGHTTNAATLATIANAQNTPTAIAPTPQKTG